MKLLLNRIFKGSEYTIGRLYVDGEYFCEIHYSIDEIITIIKLNNT